jgi:hypothetical protein
MSETHRPKRQRSPSYPGVNLETALERARTLYDRERRGTAPISAILDHWGYSPGTGPGLVTLAALKKFGLLQDEGSGPSRKARLSPLALQIILDDRDDSPERDRAIRTAALSPTIHQDLWNRFGPELQSDATMRHFLRFDRNFTDKAADELIREFRETVSFAGLSESDSLSPNGGDYSEQTPAPRTDPVSSAVASPQLSAQGATSVQLPLSASEWVTLNGAFPLSEAAWEQLLRVLQVMKPGLVAPSEKPQENDD